MSEMSIDASHSPSGALTTPSAPEFSHVVLVTGARTWNEPELVKQAFAGLWRDAQRESRPMVRPVLFSGHAPRGLDAMAERIWLSAGFEVRPFPADWSAFGRAAGMRRNQLMVDEAARLAARGTAVRVLAFFDYCETANCRQRSREQLLPSTPGHFSHGTAHCFEAAKTAWLHTQVALSSRVTPF